MSEKNSGTPTNEKEIEEMRPSCEKALMLAAELLTQLQKQEKRDFGKEELLADVFESYVGRKIGDYSGAYGADYENRIREIEGSGIKILGTDSELKDGPQKISFLDDNSENTFWDTMFCGIRRGDKIMASGQLTSRMYGSFHPIESDNKWYFQFGMKEKYTFVPVEGLKQIRFVTVRMRNH